MARNTKMAGFRQWRALRTLLWLTSGLTLLLSLLTYNYNDPTFFHASSAPVLNKAGSPGAWMAEAMLLALGYVSFIIPALLLSVAWLEWTESSVSRLRRKNQYDHYVWLIAIVMMAGWFHLEFTPPGDALPGPGAGGIVGFQTAAVAHFWAGRYDQGVMLVLFGVSLIGAFSYQAWSRNVLPALVYHSPARFFLPKEKLVAVMLLLQPENVKRARSQALPSGVMNWRPAPPPEPWRFNHDTWKAESELIASSAMVREQAVDPDMPCPMITDDALPQEVLRIKETFINQKLEVKVSAVASGPLVHRVSMMIAASEVGSRQSGDLKSTIEQINAVGSIYHVQLPYEQGCMTLDVPRDKLAPAHFNGLIKQMQTMQVPFHLPIMPGCDVSGQAFCLDLTQGGHGMVYGSNEPGLRRVLHASLLSMLLHQRPAQCGLMLLQPESQIFDDYEGLPHLMAPPVNDAGCAMDALRDMLNIVEQRLQALSECNATNFLDYNQSVKNRVKCEDSPNATQQDSTLQPWARIIIMIHHLDLLEAYDSESAQVYLGQLAEYGPKTGLHLFVTSMKIKDPFQSSKLQEYTGFKFVLPCEQSVSNEGLSTAMNESGLLPDHDVLFFGRDMKQPERLHTACVTKEQIEWVNRQWRFISPGKAHRTPRIDAENPEKSKRTLV